MNIKPTNYKTFAAIIDYLATQLIGYEVEDDGTINIQETLDGYEICTIKEIINSSPGD